MEKIKCLITDGNWIFRNGVVKIIEDKIQSVTFQQASNLEECKQLLIKENYEILIFGFTFRDPNALSIIQSIKKVAPNSKIIICTSSINYFNFFEIKDFVNAIIPKSSTENRLIECFKYVLNNYENYFLGLDQPMIHKIKQLSERELEVALLLTKGLSNKQIVYKLNLKETTVSTIRKRILTKLEIDNSIHLVHFFWKSIL